MTHKVEATDESISKVIVDDLVWHIYGIAQPNDDIYETPANKIHTLSYLLSTLEFYTTRDEFKELTKDLKVKMKPSKKEG